MFTDCKQCYKFLYDLTNLEHNLHSQKAKEHYNLDNISFLYNKLIERKPDLLVGKKIIHIAGTKGKGSTAYLISSILMSMFNVATFVSPHLIKPNERFLFNLKQINDTQFVEYTNFLVDFLSDCDIVPTTFEAFYLMFLIFAYKSKSDILVVETGLGGRLDATNVTNSDISVITPIGYDHIDLLGNTIEAIAKEKAAIIKSGKGVISKQYYEISEVFNNQSKLANVPIIDATKFNFVSTFHNFGYDIIYKNYNLRLEAIGLHQESNLQTAIATVDTLFPNFDYTNVILQVPPARIELVQNNPPIILDVSHNRESVDTLVDTLQKHFPDQSWTIISSMASDKDYKYFYKKLSTIANQIIITSLNESKCCNPVEIYKYVTTLCQCKLIMDPVSAIEQTFHTNNNILVTGSFYLTGPVMEYLNYEKNHSF